MQKGIKYEIGTKMKWEQNEKGTGTCSDILWSK